jgi:hypothetical protein
MNVRKIAFLTCVSDPALYRLALRSHRSLPVPQGFEVEFVGIPDARSMTSGYNRAMRATDAKYKIYLHQDVIVVHRRFLSDVVERFASHPELGMLGVVGAAELPKSGIWWHSPLKYGMVYGSPVGQMVLLRYGDVRGDYEPVQSIDGLIMATQYDLKWREDLFPGWHYYDLSQCAEFRRAGYEVGVVPQKTPWCVHDCGVSTMQGFEESRRVFLQHYGFRPS